MPTLLPEWRCTRPAKYPPMSKPEDREGYYIRAASSRDAADKLRERYPYEPIDVQLWKSDDGSSDVDRDTVHRFRA